jgi:Trk-type K+ transport system membrane component
MSIGKLQVPTKVHSIWSFILRWLVWALFILAIIERKNLLDESKKWFDLFRVLFELVSVFGCIGLSLGFPLAWICLTALFAS